jgi:hypothetical protein
MREGTIVAKTRARVVISSDGVASIVFRDPIKQNWHSISTEFDVLFDDNFAHDSLDDALESVDLLTITEVTPNGKID